MSSTEFKKKKINVFTILGLFLAIGMSGYVVFGTNSDYNSTDAEIKKLQAEEKKNDIKMQENPMYKRLNAYGLGLSTIGDILKYKDISPTWFQFLQDFARSIPKNITIRSLQYSPQKGILTMNILSPERDRLIETMSLIEDFDGIKNVDFDGITEEKVTFKGEKVQYTGFGVSLTTYVDPEYLKLKYETAEVVREEKLKGSTETTDSLESQTPETQSGKTSIESMLDDTNTGTGEANVIFENPSDIPTKTGALKKSN